MHAAVAGTAPGHVVGAAPLRPCRPAPFEHVQVEAGAPLTLAPSARLALDLSLALLSDTAGQGLTVGPVF
jgi:hypothetical protein